MGPDMGNETRLPASIISHELANSRSQRKSLWPSFYEIEGRRTIAAGTDMPTNVEVPRTARVVSIDLDLAVAFYETFLPSGQDAKLIARVNESDFYPAFNVISDSLHRNAIMALCRIWDTQSDSANLNSLAKMFRNNQVLTDLARAGHVVDPKQMKKWQADVAKVKDSDELEALMAARHRALAHTANPNKAYRGKARVAVYGDERRVMEWTIPLVERANAFISYSYARPFDEQRTIRREHAAKFWARVGESSPAN
jgi:AbiU2